MYEPSKNSLGGKPLFIGALPPKYRITLSYAYSSMAACAAATRANNQRIRCLMQTYRKLYAIFQ